MMISLTSHTLPGHHRAQFRAALLGGAMLALTLPGVVHAQTSAAAPEEAQPAPPPPPGEGNEIVVTATKRAQTLQSVPVAVTVTTAATLERAQIRDIADLQSVVPALRVEQEQSSANTNFVIRGFGNGANNAGIEPSVGVFIDGVYRSRVAASLDDFPNVSRIEVLRGPQSTLFGKNASAGVISITTSEPQFTLGGGLEGTYENFNGIVAKGLVTGPITQTLAVSIAAGLDKRDGYFSDPTTNSTINNRNRWFVRGQALFEPNSQLKVRLIADYSRLKELCCGVVNLQASGATQIIQALGGQVNPASNPYGDITYSNFNPTNDIRNYGGSGQIDYTMGPFKLTSITALRQSDSYTNQDADFSSADLIGQFAQQQHVNTFTQELRLASNLPGPINFLLGGFYFDEHIRQTNQLTYGTQFAPYANQLILAGTGGALNLTQLEEELGQALTGNPASFLNTPGNPNQFFGAGQGTNEHYTLGDQSISIFAQADYKVTPKITLTGGINFTHDAKRYTENDTSSDVFSNLNLPAIVNGGINQAYAAYGAPGAQAAAAQLVPLLALMPLQFIPSVTPLPNAAEPGQTEDNNVSFTARAAYDASQAVKFYASVSTGFKPSSINLSRDARPPASSGLAGPATIPIGVTGGTPILTIANPAYGSRVAGPEKSTNFEIGMKGHWGPATLNVAAFREIIKGFQSNLFTGTGFFLANAGQESEWGIETEGSYRVGHELTLSGAVSWYDPRYDSFVQSIAGDISGSKPSDIPEWTVNLGAEENHRFSNGDRVILRGGWHYESRVATVDGLSGATNAQSIALAQSFTKLVSEIDSSLTYSMAKGLDFMVWGRNLNNNRYHVIVFPSPAQTGSISGYNNEPRAYGVTVRARW